MLVLVFQIFVIRAQGSSKAWLLSWVKCSVSAFSTILITCLCLCFKSLWSLITDQGAKKQVEAFVMMGVADGEPAVSHNHWSFSHQLFIIKISHLLINPQDHQETLPKAQRIQGIEYSDTYNTFSSKQKLQETLKSWSNFSFVLFGKRREMHRTTLKNPCNNFDKSM